MTEVFGVRGDGQNITQPNPAGEPLIFRSSNGADTGVNVTITGEVGMTLTAETNPLSSADGRVEIQTAASFKSLNQVQLASPLSGDLSVMGQGSSAAGRIEVTTVPSDGHALTVSLSGLSGPVYTLQTAPLRSTWWMRCVPDVAGSLAGTYFDIADGSGPVRVWFKVSGSGSAPSTPVGGRLIQINVATGNTAAVVAGQVQSTLSLDGHFFSLVSYENYVQVASLTAVATSSGSAGTSGFAFKQTQVGIAGTFNYTTANQIRRGATPAEHAAIINSLLNGTTGAGAAWTVTCFADVAGSLNQTHFIIPTSAGTLAIWFSNSHTATPPAGALAAAFETMVSFSNGDSAALMAGQLVAATLPAGLSKSLAGTTVTITRPDFGPVAGGHSSGTSTFTVSQSVTGAYGGANSAAASYGVGTTANPYVSAEADGYVVTITDRLKVNRFFGWDISQFGTGLTIIPMIGGVNGPTLATIPAGQTSINDPFTLESLNLATPTLPALLTPTCDAIQIGSVPFEVHVIMQDPPDDEILWRLEWTDDPALENWAQVGETVVPIRTGIALPTEPYVLQITSVRPEFIRLVILENDNPTPMALDFRVNYPR